MICCRCPVRAGVCRCRSKSALVGSQSIARQRCSASASTCRGGAHRGSRTAEPGRCEWRRAAPNNACLPRRAARGSSSSSYPPISMHVGTWVRRDGAGADRGARGLESFGGARSRSRGWLVAPPTCNDKHGGWRHQPRVRCTRTLHSTAKISLTKTFVYFCTQL